MKSRFLLSTLMATLLLFFASCEKDKSDLTKEEVASQIQGKWQINTILLNEYYDGRDHKQTFTGASGDYIEFKSNGEMVTNFQGQTTTSTYSVRSSNVLVIDNDPASIQEFTDNKLRLYTKDETGSLGFTEVTYDLKR